MLCVDWKIPEPTAAATTITDFESRERSRGGRGIGFSASADFANAAPYTQLSTAQSRNNPISATGPRCQRKSRYLIPENDPISMFCGLPVIVATLPMFDAVATASR